MREEDIDKLREQLNQKAELSEEDMAEVVRLDAVLPMSYFTVDTIRQLSVLEPYGKSNTRPVFADRNIKITRAGIICWIQRGIRWQESILEKWKNFLHFSVKSLAVKKWMQLCMEKKTAYSLQPFMSRQWTLTVEEKVYRQ